MGAPSPGDAGQSPGPPLTAYQRFWKRPDVIGIIVLVSVAVNVALLLRPSPEPPPEVVQRLEAGGATYLLGFHRARESYSTVTRDGVRVFDARKQGAGLCLRLHATPQGGIEAECHERDGHATRRFPVPSG